MADNFDAKDLLGDFQAMVNEAKKNMEKSMQEYTESVVDEIKKSDEEIKKAVKNQKPLDLGKLEAIAEVVIKSDNIDEATKQYATDVKNQVQKAVKKEKIKTEFEINPSFIIKKTSKGERIKTQTELEEHISKNYDKGTIAKDKKFIEYYSAAKELGYNISIPGIDSKEMEEYYNELISGNKELALHAEKAVEVLRTQVIELNNQKQAAIETREIQKAAEQAKRDELEKTNQALEEQRRQNEALQRELEETKAKMKEASTTLSQSDQSSVLSGTTTTAPIEESIKLQDNLGREIDDNNAKLLKGTQLIDEQNKGILTLYHNSNSVFDKFDSSKSGANQGMALGAGNYLSTMQNGEYNNLEYGKFQTQWYAFVKNAFDMQKNTISQQEADTIAQKYFGSITEGFGKYLSQNLSSKSGSGAVGLLKDAADKAQVSLGEIFNTIGYDAIKDAYQINVFNEDNIVRASNAILDISQQPFENAKELSHQLYVAEKSAEDTKKHLESLESINISNLSKDEAKKKIEGLDNTISLNDLMGVGWISGKKDKEELAAMAAAYQQMYGESLKLESITQEIVDAHIQTGTSIESEIERTKSQLVLEEEKVTLLRQQANEQLEITRQLTDAYLKGNQTPLSSEDISQPIDKAEQEVKEFKESEKQASEEAQKLAKTIAEEFGVKSKKTIQKLGIEIDDVLAKLREANSMDMSDDEFDFFMSTPPNYHSILDVLAEDAEVARSAIGNTYDSYDKLRAYVSKSSIKNDSSFKSEFGDDWHNVRNTIGSTVIQNNKGTDIMIFLEELNSVLGTTFDISGNAADGIRQLYEALENGKTDKLEQVSSALVSNGALDHIQSLIENNDQEIASTEEIINSEEKRRKYKVAARNEIPRLAKQESSAIVEANENIIESNNNAAKSFGRVAEEANKPDWDKISQRMSDYGEEPFYEARQKTTKGSASYRTSTETYKYNRDTEELELESVQIVNDMKKLRDEQIRENEKIKRASSQVQKFIASFDNKTLGKGEQLKGYSKLKEFDIKSLSDIDKAIVMMQNLDAEYSKVMQNFRKGSSSLNPFVNAINNSDKLSTSIKSIAIDFKSLKNPSDELKNKFGQLDAQLGEFNKSLKEDDIYGMSKAYGELKSNISQVIDLIKLQKKEESQQAPMSGSKIGTFYDFESAKQGALEYARSLGEVTKELQYSDVPNKSGIYTMTAEIKEASGEVKKLSFNWKDAMSEMTVSSKFLRTELKGLPGLFQEIGKKVRQLGVYWAANFLNPMDLLQYGRTWFNFAKQYDDALTNMRKVSSETIGTLQDFQKESFELADAVGTTASQLQNSTVDFLRLGESLEEAKQSAQDANILFNVSEFTNIDDATSSLISMGQAYNELDKMDIIDKLNIVGNNYAISTDELAQALQNSASALKVAGNDIDEAIALATTANTIVQDYSKVSAGIRTVSMRITGATAEELQEAGEDTEGLIETTAKLEEQVKSLTAVNGKMGVSLLDANGNFRSTYEILLDIAKVWEEIGKQDKLDGNNRQNVLLESLAGKNRASILAAILQSPDILESVYKTSSQDSEGSAQQELEKQLESISGHVAKLQNQWQNLWAETANRDVINFFLDLATSILKVVDGIGIIPTLLVGGGGIFAAIKTFKGEGK